MPCAAWIDLFLEATDRRQIVSQGGLPHQTFVASVGSAARVGAGGATGHAATPGFGASETGFCLEQAESKAGVAVPRSWKAEFVEWAAAAAADIRADETALDENTARLQRTIVEIEERVRHLPPGSHFHVQGFVDAQVVSILRHDEEHAVASDARQRWGIAIDIVAPAHNGRIWIERSRGGAGGFCSEAIQSLARELEGIDKLIGRAGDAGSLPAGRYDAVLSAEAASLFFHEVVGHFCEESSVVASGTKLALGQMLCPAGLWVDDDATLSEMFGSRRFDDTARTTHRIPLIADGRLFGLLIQEGRDGLGHVPVVPCAVRQDYRHPPLARMSNIIVRAGTGTAEDFITDMRAGLFITKLAEGSIDAHSGECTLVATEAYSIQDGWIDAPLRPFVIEGSGSGMLSRVCAIGKDIANVASYCTGNGGIVPVGGRAASCVVGSLKVRPLET